VNYNNHSAMGIAAGGVIAIVVISLVFFIAYLWAYVNIIRRTGYSGWWVLIGLVPIANIVMFFVFAFKEWPIQRELRALRAQAGGGYGGGQYPGGPGGQYPQGPQGGPYGGYPGQ
jgi:hypothetical protein